MFYIGEKFFFTSKVKRETARSFLGFQVIQLVPRKVSGCRVRQQRKLAQYVIPRVSVSKRGGHSMLL